jgi:diaminopropionate ammonia-lyase
LACGEPSLLAWNVLDAAAFAFMTIEDSSVVTEMCRLASPLLGDTPLVAGESAACGLAGLAKALCEPDIARALGLTSAARILVFGSEGDTDPELYAKFTASTAP